jgi:hypothetical protein
MDRGKEYLKASESRRNSEVNIEILMTMYTPDSIKTKAQNKGVSILSIGSGGSEEIPAIDKIFPKVKYTGIDSNPSAINLSRNRYPNHQLDFIEADATKPENIPADQDLVLIRKPQVSGSSLEEYLQPEMIETWKKIFSNGTEALSPDGYMIITTTTIQEMEAVMNYLQSSELSLESALGRELFHQIDLPQEPVVGNEDKFISVLKKNKQSTV